MDNDVVRMMRRAVARPARDLGPGAAVARGPEWAGTGLCPEAQADGVPCYEAGRSCDICGRAGTWLSGDAQAGERAAEGASGRRRAPRYSLLQ